MVGDYNRYSNNRRESFVTNFRNNDIECYKKAIIKYSEIKPNHGLSIKSEAYDCHGFFYEGSSSLHLEHESDLSDFWEIYDKIKHQ